MVSLPAMSSLFSEERPRGVSALLLRLVSRYPEQFKASHLDVQAIQGWIPLFGFLCDDVSRLPENAGGYVRWVQIKEKFGSMRARYSIAPELSEALAQDLRNKVTALCEQARNASETSCKICGAPAFRADQSMDALLCKRHWFQRMKAPEKFKQKLAIRIYRENLQITSFCSILAEIRKLLD